MSPLPYTLPWCFTAGRMRDVAFSLTRNGYWKATRTPVGDTTVERVEIDANQHFPDVNRDNNVWSATN